MRRCAWLVVLGVSSVGCAGLDDTPLEASARRLGSGLLEIHQINVGWGSSVLVSGPDGTTVLLEAGDTGMGAARVVPFLQSRGILPAHGIDYTIAGHQHCDHIGGLDEVTAAGYDVRLGNYFNGSGNLTSCVTQWNEAAADTTAGLPVAALPGQEIALGGGARLIFVAVDGDLIGGGSVEVSNENDRSIAVLVKHGGFDYLWASDLGGGNIDNECTGRFTSSQIDVETAVVQAISPGGAAPLISAGGVDVLNVNHHGSESSTNMNWMNYSAPAVALIGTGAGQSSGWEFPRIDVVDKVLLSEAACITAEAALVLQSEEGDPTGPQTSFRGHCVGNITVKTDGLTDFIVEADGQVTQGPNEVMAAGLPRQIALDDAPAGPDTTPPATAILSPAAGATLYGAVSVTATASDAVGVTRVELWIDGALHETDTSAPYAFTWNTLAATAGAHDLWTEAFDAAENRGVSALVPVTVVHSLPARVILNEILANEPGSDTAGEFVELVNVGGEPIGIAGWTISDSIGLKHTFAAGAQLDPGAGIVVFAGAQAIPPGTPNAVAASTGTLGLNNGGDTVTVRDGGGATVDALTYGSSLAGTDGVSMNRNPDLSPTGGFVLHTTISAQPSSPGRRADGGAFATCVTNANCDDGNTCNGAEVCQAGSCVAGAPPTCDDGNACNGAETCNPASGCAAGAPLTCDDGDACNGAETCNPASGCVAGTPVVCDDGDACNGVETCQAGSCSGGAPPSCDDGDPCTADSCVPTTGCAHEDICVPTVIASDGFEAGLTGGSGWSEASWRIAGDTSLVSNDGPHSGARHVRLRSSTGSLKRTVSLAGRSGARLRVWTKVTSFESADRAQVRVTVTPGTGYGTLLTNSPSQSDGQYHFYDLDLGACDGAATCEIFFDAQMNANNDRWYIDDVEVTAF